MRSRLRRACPRRSSRSDNALVRKRAQDCLRPVTGWSVQSSSGWPASAWRGCSPVDCALQSGRGLATRLALEPVSNVADDDDAAGNDDRRRGYDACTDDERSAALVLTTLNGGDLGAFEKHVVGHDLALGVVDLGGSRYIDARREQGCEAHPKQ